MCKIYWGTHKHEYINSNIYGNERLVCIVLITQMESNIYTKIIKNPERGEKEISFLYAMWQMAGR